MYISYRSVGLRVLAPFPIAHLNGARTLTFLAGGWGTNYWLVLNPPIFNPYSGCRTTPLRTIPASWTWRIWVNTSSPSHPNPPRHLDKIWRETHHSKNRKGARGCGQKHPGQESARGDKGALQNQGQKFTCNQSPHCAASKTLMRLLLSRNSAKSSTCREDRGAREDAGKWNKRYKGRRVSSQRNQ